MHTQGDSTVNDRRSASVLQENIYKTDAPRQHAELKDVEVRKIISEITRGKHRRILDVGCGDGSLLQSFSETNECFGLDISMPQLEKAEKKNIRALRVDLETGEFPFPNDSFDLVICSETIEHLLDVDNLLSEAHRILKFEGSLILTFPNINQPVSWLMQIIYDLPPMYSARYKSPHVRDYTARIVKNILVDFGFEVIRARGTYIYPNKGRISKWLAERFPRLAEKIIIVSEKRRKGQTLRKKVIWNVLEITNRNR